MTRKMKYIIFEVLSLDGLRNDDVPLIFPENLNHADVARTFGKGGVVDSAGFCELVDIEINPRDNAAKLSIGVAEKDVELGVRWVCSGESKSLGIASKLEYDERILDRWYR